MTFNPFGWLWRLLSCLCGGSRRIKRDKPRIVEEERLLRPSEVGSSAPTGVHTTIAVAQVAADQGQAEQLAQAAALPDEYTSTVIVMRHGHRQDEEDSFWHQTAARPWDPPLSVKGRVQANDVASKLGGHTIDVVITSPFRRCLQTSAGVVKQLGLQQGQWLVDWQLSEVCDPRVLFSGRHDLREKAGKRPLDSWMWDGLALQAALDKFSNEDCKLSKLPLRPVPRPGSRLPRYPENLEQGLARYSSALQEIGKSYAGKTVLVVTHGECVRMAVVLGEPHSEVFEVKHTGFVVLQQHVTAADTAAAAVPAPGAKSSSGSRAKHVPWKLVSEPGENGVFWLDDEEED